MYKIKDALQDFIHHIHVIDQKSLATIDSYERELKAYTSYLINECKLEYITEIFYVDGDWNYCLHAICISINGKRKI